MSNSTEDTVDFVPGNVFADTLFAAEAPPVQVNFGAVSHPGRVRPNNEDHYAVVRRNRSSELLLSNLNEPGFAFTEDAAHIMVVADGMGGARFGEFASRLALRTLFQLASQATSWVMKLADFERQQVRERVAAYVERMQAALRDFVSNHPQFAGMGTTCTLAYLMPPRAIVVHIGDSRAYLFRDGQLQQITRDETMAQAFVDAGMDPASVKKFSHVLLNTLGGEQDEVAAQIHQLEFGAGDQLLLCSDGLYDMVDDGAIAQQLLRGDAPQATCEALLQRALDNGGRDNVTIVLAVGSTQAA